MTILVTGGLGFIGSSFIRKWVKLTDELLICIDNNSLKTLNKHQSLFGKNALLCLNSIGEKSIVKNIFEEHQPRAVVNFAAESHVDVSISNPVECIKNNVVETAKFLEAIIDYFDSSKHNIDNFQFLQVSTDEVYGSTMSLDQSFVETDILSPQNPYSSSKASAECIVQAFGNTYGLRYKITRCSNNFGPFQSEQKLIPKAITHFLSRKPMPIFGGGEHVRDWLFVDDHIQALLSVIDLPDRNVCLNISSQNELSNVKVVRKIASLLDGLEPLSNGSYKDLIAFVKDRPGHDKRYSMNADKIKKLTSWNPQICFDSALEKTILHYVQHGFSAA